MLDVRNGFPLSIVDAERNFVGPRNEAVHFPTFFSLDIQALKSVTVPGKWKNYRLRLGLKVFNLTNHFNEGVRKATTGSLFTFLKTFYVMSNPAPWEAGLPLRYQFVENVQNMNKAVMDAVMEMWKDEHDK